LGTGDCSVLKNTTLKAFIVAAAVISVATYGLIRSGDYLVVNQPEHSDVIVVLAGDHNDLRYWRGLELLRDGFGQRMLVDAAALRIYGRSVAELAAEFVARTAGDKTSQIGICTITEDSTVQEASDIRRCLAQVRPAPQSVLLVTNDYHTRRALSILRSRLSQYHWSASGVHDTSIFGEAWWRNREWAKTYAYEWEKFLWWRLFESWRS
jgi:uncharacterized SAM-binding protein YcdF (DUF218 family)